MQQLQDDVASCPERDALGAGDVESTLSGLCARLGVDRVSLHTLNQRDASFRVVAGGGEAILAMGTELPLMTSTQVAIPAAGGTFQRSSFDEGAFDQPLDHLVREMGYRSGVSIPLFMGSSVVGALCASSRDPELDTDPVIGALTEVSVPMTLAVHEARLTVVPRVLICHDDPLLAEGIARVIEHALGAHVRICSTVRDAVEHVERSDGEVETLVCHVLFDGVRVDSLLRTLRSAGATGPALVIASNASQLSRNLALQSGATGYVTANEGSIAIAGAVRALAAGGTSGWKDRNGALAEAPCLTPRESNVLLLLERGRRFKEIAQEMSISESTAKGYARNVFSKLNAHSRGEAVYEARRQGLFDFLGVV